MREVIKRQGDTKIHSELRIEHCEKLRNLQTKHTRLTPLSVVQRYKGDECRNVALFTYAAC